MATKTQRVELQVSYRLLSSPDSGQPESEKFKAAFSNLGSAMAIAGKKDDNRDTIQLPADATTVTIDLTAIGTVDYLVLMGDGAFSVQFGTGDVKSCKSIWVSDGPVPSATMKLTMIEASPRLVNVTMGVIGH